MNNSLQHIPILLTTSSGEQAIEEFSRLCDSILGFDRETLSVLKESTDIDTSLLIVSTGSLESEGDWINSLYKFRRAITVINRKLRYRVYFHLAIKGPISLAFGAGVTFGSLYPFTIYHFQNNQYFPIEVPDVRYLKQRVKEQNYDPLVVSFTEGEGSEVAVVISMSQHDPLGDAKRFLLQRFGIMPSILVIEHPLRGNLPVHDYIEVTRRIASAIQDLRARRSIDKFHFFFSSPVSLAFLLGVVFGCYSPFSINHYSPITGEFLSIRGLHKKVHEWKMSL